ncbi:protein of unknown function DUF201 [Ferroglobus placidus DSM 10642]|uniref:ATP-grasp domain-containing protein n=1 Tax=Ferroglobus placidus (strain DSM 10642 / AEDII12DO) TaxID=589924 RepID=D3RX41_FERPA|nr:ATP-grasp domain-containing protein [Ferroglobus placidus]ADC65054.1 protein of unknown function DUF201 [Ferroglobus placidus DSM 10642]
MRNVVESARKAGYEVYAYTKHIDADLILYAEKVFRAVENHKENEKRVKELSESLNAEVILSSGFELLDVENFGSKVREELVDKLKFYRELEKIGINFPKLLSDGERGILKPRIGGGGEGIKFGEINEDGYVHQEFVEGIPCSVSAVRSEKEFVVAGVNLMLVGDRNFFASKFKYCGNVTPFVHERVEEMVKIAEDLGEHFELIGNYGVDFILGDDVYVLEVNPRFQGSLDSIELSSDVNLFELHVRAVEGKKLEKVKPKRTAARAVVFAPRRVKIKVSPTGNPFFGDIPVRGEVYDKESPLLSVFATGNNYYEKLLSRRNLYFKMQGVKV